VRQKAPPVEAVSPFLSGVSSQNRDIPIGLVRDHVPTPREAGQNRGFGSALGQEHQTVTFIGLSPAPICGVHCGSLHDAISFPAYFLSCLFLAADVPEHSGEAGDEVVHPGGFMLRLSLFSGFVAENLPVVRFDWNSFWRGHVVMFLRSEGNLLL
jgi:hypothetical protein